MRITKFGHSCLLIEEGGAIILVDPGSYSTGQDEAQGIDAILITHEHQHHLSLDSLKKVIANNPDAKIFTQSAVGKLLDDASIPYTRLEDGGQAEVKGVSIRGIGTDHAIIHDSIPVVRNTGYLVANKFFYPGDMFTVPKEPVDILALPVSAPWMRVGEAIDYARAVKARVSFPVHDGMLREPGFMHGLVQKVLASFGISFVPLQAGGVIEDGAV